MDAVRSHGWKSVTAAAARLAGIYAIGVLILYAPIRFWLLPHAGGLHELPGLSVELGILAAIAFVILAAARRVGFVLLWGVLLANWVSNLNGPYDSYPEVLLGNFILWTVLALPLYAIAALGGSDKVVLRVADRRIRVSEIGALFWILLIIGSFAYVFLQSPVGSGGTLVRVVARFVWFPAPFILALIAIATIWVRPANDPARAA